MPGGRVLRDRNHPEHLLYILLKFYLGSSKRLALGFLFRTNAQLSTELKCHMCVLENLCSVLCKVLQIPRGLCSGQRRSPKEKSSHQAHSGQEGPSPARSSQASPKLRLALDPVQ